MNDIKAMLKIMIDKNASDLHLRVGCAPISGGPVCRGDVSGSPVVVRGPGAASCKGPVSALGAVPPRADAPVAMAVELLLALDPVGPGPPCFPHSWGNRSASDRPRSAH